MSALEFGRYKSLVPVSGGVKFTVVPSFVNHASDLMSATEKSLVTSVLPAFGSRFMGVAVHLTAMVDVLEGAALRGEVPPELYEIFLRLARGLNAPRDVCYA